MTMVANLVSMPTTAMTSPVGAMSMRTFEELCAKIGRQPLSPS
jgi:hypothetical protein